MDFFFPIPAEIPTNLVAAIVLVMLMMTSILS